MVLVVNAACMEKDVNASANHIRASGHRHSDCHALLMRPDWFGVSPPLQHVGRINDKCRKCKLLDTSIGY